MDKTSVNFFRYTERAILTHRTLPANRKALYRDRHFYSPLFPDRLTVIYIHVSNGKREFIPRG